MSKRRTKLRKALALAGATAGAVMLMAQASPADASVRPYQWGCTGSVTKYASTSTRQSSISASSCLYAAGGKIAGWGRVHVGGGSGDCTVSFPGGYTCNPFKVLPVQYNSFKIYVSVVAGPFPLGTWVCDATSFFNGFGTRDYDCYPPNFTWYTNADYSVLTRVVFDVKDDGKGSFTFDSWNRP